jgi:peptidoglycan-N-acetylglucosamine deacetylase
MMRRPRKNDLLALLPDRLVLTRRGQTAERYLTFDDGPDPEHTPPLLDLLRTHGIKATFFVVGEKVEQHPHIVERMVREGHAIGNHSYSHWSFRHMSMRQRIDEVDRTDDLLRRFGTDAAGGMRPPHGYIGPRLLLHFARHRRRLTYWSYDSLDYQDQPTPVLVERLRAQPPAPGDIVLMHDDHGRAAEALAALLPEWLGQGMRFAALAAGAP